MNYQSFQPGGQPQYQSPMDLAGSSQPSEPKHFLNKKFAIIFIILALLGAGVYAGIWYWQDQQVVQEVVPTFTPRPTDPTADWKTYRNEEYGFQVKYMPDWVVEGGRDKVTFLSIVFQQYLEENKKNCKNGSQSCNLKPYGQSVIFYALGTDEPQKSGYKPESKKIFNGVSFDVYTREGLLGGFTTTYVTTKKGIIYNFYTDNQNLPHLDQILSTFKFIDSNQGQTVCTQDAKQCPDGSYVGRTGPNCEFVCPK